MSSHVIWKFEAPQGTRFVNETGSGANLYFGPGMEMEVYQALFVQLQKHLQQHLANEARLQAMMPDNSMNVVKPAVPLVRAAPVTSPIQEKKTTNEQDNQDRSGGNVNDSES